MSLGGHERRRRQAAGERARPVRHRPPALEGRARDQRLERVAVGPQGEPGPGGQLVGQRSVERRARRQRAQGGADDPARVEPGDRQAVAAERRERRPERRGRRERPAAPRVDRRFDRAAFAGQEDRLDDAGRPRLAAGRAHDQLDARVRRAPVARRPDGRVEPLPGRRRIFRRRHEEGRRILAGGRRRAADRERERVAEPGLDGRIAGPATARLAREPVEQVGQLRIELSPIGESRKPGQEVDRLATLVARRLEPHLGVGVRVRRYPARQPAGRATAGNEDEQGRGQGDHEPGDEERERPAPAARPGLGDGRHGRHRGRSLPGRRRRGRERRLADHWGRHLPEPRGCHVAGLGGRQRGRDRLVGHLVSAARAARPARADRPRRAASSASASRRTA